MERSRLHAATARAVAENRDLALRTARRLADLSAALRSTEPCGGLALDDPVVAAARGLEQTALHAVRHKLDELATQLLSGMNTFNIALFGRTGAGKSSLLEALTAGNGDSISPGESDWTKIVNPVDWASCQIVDTPGIQGWGRDTERSTLEDRARKALITADIVLLCFDNIHQQAGEFQKVADWVATYGKPAIAVLNVREREWRVPQWEDDRASRLVMTQSIAEHATHILEGLTAIGLADTPLVAIHAQRAAFARVTEPWKGPPRQLKSMRKVRAEFGIEQLLEMSHLPLLEQLLAAVVDEGATTLRRGMLLRQVAAALHASAAHLLTVTENPVRADAEQAERGLEQMLAVLGAPEGHLRITGGIKDPAVKRLIERMSKLEEKRGGGLQAPAVGAAERHGQNLIEVTLGPLRLDAGQAAEVLVESAILSGRKVEGEEFQRTVFDEAAIERATTRAVEELSAYLEARVGLAAEDVVADLRAVQRTPSTVRGSAGRGHRWISVGTGAGTAGVGITVALVNFWNPVGWTVLAGSLAVGLVGPWVAKWLRKRGQRVREQEISRARASARQAVAETFDRLRDELVAWFAAVARQALTDRLGTVVDQALLLRRVGGTARTNSATITALAETIDGDITQDLAATTVLAQAVRRCEEGAVTAPTRRWLWLGESWCDDPTGLKSPSSEPWPAATPPPAGPAGLGPRVTERLSAVLGTAVATPPPGNGREWLNQLGPLLAEDPDAAPLLADLYQILNDDRPSIVIYGDYNAGKSSFIRRILVDDGRRVPKGLRVGAAPKTNEIATYEWAGLRLIDTPGLQSGRPGHTAAAQAAVPGATLILYMLGATTVVGDRTGLDLILRGDPERGLVPKLDRTVFVVNRADELGVSPFDDEDAFADLIARKERELRSALVATTELRDVSVPAERIIFVASDPGGRVGDRTGVGPADFNRRRAWDGMDEVRAVLRVFGPYLHANGADTGVLHTGLARLSELAGAARERAGNTTRKIEQLDRVADDLREIDESADLIEKRAREGLTRTVVGHVDQLLDDALMATETTRTTILSKAVRFWQDPELQQKADQWTATTHRRVDQWAKEGETVLSRRLGSRAFQQAMLDGDAITPVRFPGASGDGAAARRFGPAVARAVEVVAKARADQMIRAGVNASTRILVASIAEQGARRSVGVLKALLLRKNALEGGARLARIGRGAGKVGAGLQVVMSVTELALLIRDLKADTRREQQFTAARRELHNQAEVLAAELADRNKALATLRAGRDALSDAAEATLADRATHSAERKLTRRRITAYDTAIRIGQSLLTEEGQRS